MFILFLLPKAVRNKMQRHMPLKWLVSLFLWLVVSLVLFMFSFKWIEGVSWEEAAWQTWQTATTVGYGNRPAETTAGRISTMFFGLVSIAFLGTAISAAFDLKAYLKDRARYGLMKNPVKAGYVIFNFPGVDLFIDFIQEIRSKEKHVGVCIVDNRLEKLPPPVELLPDIHFITGDILSRKTYERAALKENKIVVIFPSDPSAAESDGSTKTVVDLVLRFVDETTRVIYVLVKQGNAWMFDKRAVGVWQNLEMLAVVQECQDFKSSGLLQQILENRRGADPYTVKPNKIVGWTWEQFVMASLKAAHQKKISINPFALISTEEIYPCPDVDRQIKEGDLISVLAEKDFNWEDFEKDLSYK